MNWLAPSKCLTRIANHQTLKKTHTSPHTAFVCHCIFLLSVSKYSLLVSSILFTFQYYWKCLSLKLYFNECIIIFTDVAETHGIWPGLLTKSQRPIPATSILLRKSTVEVMFASRIRAGISVQSSVSSGYRQKHFPIHSQSIIYQSKQI